MAFKSSLSKSSQKTKKQKNLRKLEARRSRIKRAEARPKIKAIIFDIGGVLVLPKNPAKLSSKGGHRSLGVHEHVARKLRISLDQYFDSIDTIYAMSIEGQIPEKEAIRLLAKNLGVSEKKLKTLYNAAYKKNFKQNKVLYKFAYKLKKKGYKIAVLSDQWYLSKKALVRRRLLRRFDAVIISCDVGVRKPNPEIYKLALKKIGAKPSEALFIDNQKWNIDAAKKLGIKTILYKNNEQLFRQLSKQGLI